MSEAGKEETRPNEPGSLDAAADPAPQRGFLGSWIDTGAAASSAWSLWESVKNNPRVVEAQQQAQHVLQQYDAETVRARLAELGRSATDYIDEADRRLETLETGAVEYLQKRGTELADRVRQAAAGPEREGEVLFSGPERSPVSRLDAELQALHTSPDRLRAKTDAPPATLSAGQIADLLAQYPELAKLHTQLEPELGEAEFWSRYMALRDELEKQDRRRKMLIESQSEDMFEGWGSSDDEREDGDEAADATKTGATTKDAGKKDADKEATDKKATDKKGADEKDAGEKEAGKTDRGNAAAPTDAKASAKKASNSSKSKTKPREPIDEEASDLDWE